MKKLRLLFILAILLCCCKAVGADFTVGGIAYNITSATDKTVAVTSGSTSTGDIIIPATATNDGTTYDVTSIALNAFNSRTDLTSVTIPSSVTSIGNNAFRSCSNLTAVKISDLTAWCKISFGNGNSNPLYFAHHLYLNDAEVTALEIPSVITAINKYTFYGCSGLTSVTISNSVTSIGDYAFRGCSGMATLTLSNTLTSIGTYTFYGCSSLTAVTIPNTVTSMGTSAFDGCSGMTSLTLSNSLTSIGEYVFAGCSSLPSVTIPNSVSSISNYAFKNCSSLPSITIPNSVTSIANFAFQGCTGLTAVKTTDLAAWCKISFGNGYSNPLFFAHHLYLNDTEVTALEIPASVTAIKAYAFYKCFGFTSITIPNSVTSIGNYAFHGCSGLTSVTIPNSVTSMGDQVFYQCTGLTAVTILCSFVASNAFFGCSSLSSLTLSNSVTTIGTFAFYQCTSLTALTIPSSVTSIEMNAFQYCSGLTSLTIPGSVTTIGGNAFQYCSGLTSLTLSNGIATISSSAFSHCNLTTVTIPSSVTTIGTGAFNASPNMTIVNSLKENLDGFTYGGSTSFPITATTILNIPFGTADIYKNFSQPNWGFLAANVHEAAIITISPSGYATYYSPKALDFSAVEGLDAYVATSYNSGELTATRCDKVPANTGILVKGTPGTTYALPEYTGETSPVATNMFVGINEDATVDVTTTKEGNEYTNLVLSVVGDELGFYNLLASGTLAAHKAYLPILTSALNVIGGSKKITVNFNNGGATEIKGVELNTQSDDTIYNLQGQKVVNPERGIYIVNGKKTYIK